MDRSNVISVVRVWLVGAVLLLAGGMAHAQVPWESPQLLAPGTQAGLSLMYVDFGLSPGDGAGLLLTYRPGAGPRGMGLRIAGTIPQRDDIRLSGGIDGARSLSQRSAAFPVDVMWTYGVGASYGEYHSIGVPVGLSGGRALTAGPVNLQPYVSARLVLEGYFGAARPDDTFAVIVAADAGLDASLDSQRVVLRTAVTLGDRRAVAIGLQVSPGRSATARTAAVR